MGLNDLQRAERVHIGFFGLINVGKSSLVNAFTGQQTAIVSEVEGTTTDPVEKNMELLPLGAVTIIDTPGLDDGGELGKERVRRSLRVLDKTDIAVLVVDGNRGLKEEDKDIIGRFKEKKIPYVIAYNKCDLMENCGLDRKIGDNEIFVSAEKLKNIDALKDKVAGLIGLMPQKRSLLSDIVDYGDKVVLVMSIDESAPKTRIILPQQETIRNLLDIGAVIISVKDSELKAALDSLKENPKLVITDSKVFGNVAKIVPDGVALTSFSILFARYKGDLEQTIKGVEKLKNIKDGDKILISEGCTHHRQCQDIGSVKLPAWIREYTGKNPAFSFTSGGEFPTSLKEYSLVIHCGGCMLNEREMRHRLEIAKEQGVPFTNYGVAIAQMNGILKRALAPFCEFAGELCYL